MKSMRRVARYMEDQMTMEWNGYVDPILGCSDAQGLATTWR